LVSLGAILALQLADPQARYLVAASGIIIGNAMSAATLSGRNFLRSARARASEVEAWLSLGALPRPAHTATSVARRCGSH
jgi:putative ABC transport system permease protein